MMLKLKNGTGSEGMLLAMFGEHDDVTVHRIE